MSNLHTPPPDEKPAKKPLYKRTGFWIGVAVVAVIGAAANAGQDDTNTDAKPQPAVTVTETATPAAPVKESVAPNTETTPTAEKPVEDASDVERELEPVPDVVGMNHAEAMRQLHSKGFLVNEESISPGNTFIINNSNWQVCRQDPQPGATDVLRVAIYSVKLAESC